ncbi:MAG TPA: transposase [Candidatus Omnitrophota bacterium]|nr:transposase [Candidatus Omnitrophota bacterium]
MSEKNRKFLRLKGYDYSQCGYYFVTVCTKGRVEWFGNIRGDKMELNEYGKIVNDAWYWLENQYEYVSLDEFIIMPNHIHGIICIDDCRGGSRTAPTIKSIGRLVGAFKTVSTKQINQVRNTPAMQLWQRSFFDHIIRNEVSLQRIREYIRSNLIMWAEDKENPGEV